MRPRKECAKVRSSFAKQYRKAPHEKKGTLELRKTSRLLRKLRVGSAAAHVHPIGRLVTRNHADQPFAFRQPARPPSSSSIYHQQNSSPTKLMGPKTVKFGAVEQILTRPEIMIACEDVQKPPTLYRLYILRLSKKGLSTSATLAAGLEAQHAFRSLPCVETEKKVKRLQSFEAGKT